MGTFALHEENFYLGLMNKVNCIKRKLKFGSSLIRYIIKLIKKPNKLYFNSVNFAEIN